MTPMIELGCKSDTGIAREVNEDAFAAILDAHIYMVADGVGGNSAGEVASRTAIRTVVEQVENAPLEPTGDELDVRRYFTRCLELANASVKAVGESFPENSGLATTLVLCYIEDETAYFVNVGDSRGYLYRDGQLTRITEDHSYVNTLVRMGVLTEEEARHHKRGNVITRAIGAEDTVTGDLFPIELQEGDVLLLCTDGLHGEVLPGQMEQLMAEHEDMQELCDALVDAANENGGRDNITCITLRYLGGNVNEQ